MKVLFVCLGNICRSPIAHGITEHYINKFNLSWYVDSAGTSGYHQNEPPHISSQQICQLNGIDISTQKSRPFQTNDLEHFDKIYTMDLIVYKDIINNYSVNSNIHKVLLITDIDKNFCPREIPDPYYGSKKDFEYVYHLLDDLCKKIINTYSNK